MEVVVAQPAPREFVDRGRGDLGAIAAEAAEADVVEQHEHDVRRVAARRRGLRPPGRRILPRRADASLEERFGRLVRLRHRRNPVVFGA